MYKPPLDNDDAKKRTKQFRSYLNSLRRNSIATIWLNFVTSKDMPALIKALGENTSLTSLTIADSQMSAEDAGKLAETLKSHPKLESLSLIGNGIGAEAGPLLGVLLAANRRITALRLDHEKIGDEGMEPIIAAIAGNRNFSAIETDSCRLTDRSGVALAAALADKPDVRRVVLDEIRVGQKTAEALDVSLFGRYGLTRCKPDTADLHAHYLTNRSKGDAIGGKLDEPQEMTVEERYEAVRRKPYLKEKPIYSRPLKGFEQFMNGLPDAPPLDEALTPDTLFTADKRGFCPLDNPAILDKLPEICARLAENGAPLTLSHLAGQQRDGKSYLDILAAHAPLATLVGALGAGGQRIGAGELLDGKRQPTQLLKDVVGRREEAALFMPENWKGASRQELQAVLGALPAESKARIPNLHSLQASVGRDQTHQQRGR